MRNKFVKLTMETYDGGIPVYINPLAVGCVFVPKDKKNTSVVMANEKYILVKESLDEVIKKFGG